MILLDLILLVITTGMIIIWLYFIAYILTSHRKIPSLLYGNNYRIDRYPKVSIILPARNESSYIDKCLKSLVNQDYPNYEIIAINDSSTDDTRQKILEYSKNNDNIIFVDAKPKPDDWMGKTWACFLGYMKASGDIFLFTDADTTHDQTTLTLTIRYLLGEKLDALTAIPKLLSKDYFTKLTLPILSIFMNTRFSALKVNNPKSKTGYFFGSYFAITKDCYEKVGTHEAVKYELVEDGALGNLVKSTGFRILMVKSESRITAIWARDLKSLWHGIKRLMIPIYFQNKKNAYLISIAVFFILLYPYLVFFISIAIIFNFDSLLKQLIFLMSLFNIVLISLTTAFQIKKYDNISLLYVIGCIVGCIIIVSGFLTSLFTVHKRENVIWRDRKYSINNKQNPLS